MHGKFPNSPCIRDGQQSHKYTITSPVELMNLLLKGPNESLPNNGKMRWYYQVYRLQIIKKHIDSIKWKNCADTVKYIDYKLLKNI